MIDDPLDIKVSNEAFSYLVIQRGALSDLSPDRAAWEDAYRESILSDYESMVPWLPETCSAFLDVGGGLSGISIPLSRHYGGTPYIAILDGMQDLPEAITHDRTFSNFLVASNFLAENDIEADEFISPLGIENGKELSEQMDLIISLQAWCFHIPAETYIPFVKKSANPGATLILDVRRGRDDYISDLRREFSEVGVAVDGKKFRRMVYRNDR